MATKLSQFLTVKKGPTKKVNKLKKPTGKVVKFQFRKGKKAKQLKLRWGSKNTFEDIL